MVKFMKPDASEMTKKKIIYGTASLAAILMISILVLAYNANRILHYELRQFLGRGFSAESISLSIGGVRAGNIRLVRADNRLAFSAKNLEMRANLLGLLKQEKVISDLILDSPILMLEIDSKGEVVFPLPSKARNPAKAGSDKKSPDKAATAVLIKHFEIEDGTLDYLDRKGPGGPVRVELKEMDAALRNVSIPSDDRVSHYRLNAAVSGRAKKGSISSAGDVNLKTKDTKAQFAIRDIDLTLLRPYFEKSGDVEVTNGLLSLDADITIRNNKISSTGKITIKELLFRQSGGRFLGFPLLAVMKLLKDGNNQIMLDFTIEGDLNNPKFRITESLVRKLSLSLAKNLGMPIEDIGKSVLDLGGSALKKIFK